MDSPRAHIPLWLLGLLLAALLAPAAHAAAPITIREPYVQLHSGPGRGYPAVYALEQGDAGEVLARENDWYEIRAHSGRVGWAHRKDVADSLVSAGIYPSRRDAFVDRVLANRVELGVDLGALEEDPLAGLYLGYRLTPRLSLEGRVGEVAGTFSNSRYYRLEAVFRPRLDWPVHPHISAGAGYLTNTPRPTLVGATTDDGYTASIGVGVGKLLGDHFLLRGDWRYHKAWFDGDQDEDFQELAAGFAFRF